MISPKVSVLMTAYNREKYIAEAIESVLNSTFTDFELIVVDDQSRDRTVEIARRYAEQDERVRVFVNEQNLGDYPNRNRAASLAKGTFIKYVDADDLIYPHGLQEFVRYMELFPKAAVAFSEKSQDSCRPYPLLLNPLEVYRDQYLCGKSWFGKSPLTAIIRRDSFEAVGGFSGRNQVGDFEIWHLLAQRFSVVIIPGGLVWYRLHGEQQSEERRTDPSVNFMYLLVSGEMLANADCPLEGHDRQTAITRNLRSQSRYFLRTLKTDGPKAAMKLQKMSKVSWSEMLARAFFSKLPSW